jgi:hypothetical protein
MTLGAAAPGARAYSQTQQRRHTTPARCFQRGIMKQTENTYIQAGYKVARAIKAGSAARARAAIQNFDLLLALEAEADRAEARRLYVLGYNEGQH